MAMKRRCRASPQGPVFGYYGDIGECRNRVFIDQRRTDNYREAVIRKTLFAWGKGSRILLSIAGLRQKRRCSTSRVFSGIAFGAGAENRATLQTSAEEREKTASLHQESSLFLRIRSFPGS